MRQALALLVLSAAAAPALAQGVQMKSVVSYPAGSLPRATALADMDGDGDLDVVVTAQGPAQVQVLLNAGGALSAGPSLGLGLPGDVGRVAAGDLDGDGDVDLAVTHLTGVLLLVENVGGALVTHGSVSLTAAPDDVAAGDLDGDGDLDLVVAGEQGRVLFALWNQGGFAFTQQAYPIPQGVTSLALGRVTGFTPLDVVVVNRTTNEVTVLWPSDLGVYALVPLPPVVLDNVNPYDVAVGDVDGNGFADVVAVGATYQGLTLGRGQVVFSSGAGALHKGASFFPKPGPIGSCALADLDLDGRLDLAVGGIIAPQVVAYVNDGSGTFAGQPFGFLTDYSGFDLEAADLDGDGAADLVELSPGAGQAWVLLNAATGTPCALTSYCTAKTHSLGGAASIGASGLPSFGGQGFGLVLDGAIPSAVAIGIAGTSGPAALPFAGGLLCVQPPLKRLTPRKLSPTGTGSLAVPVTTAMIGQSRWYQWWYRDAAHPDGTGVGLSDGLAVTFCQ
jgi:hypothetical protein